MKWIPSQYNYIFASFNTGTYLETKYAYIIQHQSTNIFVAVLLKFHFWKRDLLIGITGIWSISECQMFCSCFDFLILFLNEIYLTISNMIAYISTRLLFFKHVHVMMVELFYFFIWFWAMFIPRLWLSTIAQCISWEVTVNIHYIHVNA